MIVRTWTGTLAWVCMALFSVELDMASAAAPDESMNEPQGIGVTDFANQLRNHFSRHATRTSLEKLRDTNAVIECGDLQWQLQDLINKKQSLQGLSDVGITQRADGSVEIDIGQNPQWMSLHERLRPFDDPKVFNVYVPLLRERGFRDQDVEQLSAYLQANRVERLAFEATRPQIENFTALVRSSAGRKTSLTQAKAFHYRLRRVTNEAQRKWADGLLSVLDAQRQRVLASLLDELQVTRVVSADEDVDAILTQEMARMRTAAFDQTLQTKAREYMQ